MSRFNVIKNAKEYIDKVLEVVINVPWGNDEVCPVNGIYHVALTKNTDWFCQFESDDGTWFVPNTLSNDISLYVNDEKNGYYLGMALLSPSETYLYSHDDLYETIFHTIWSDDLSDYYLKNKDKMEVLDNKIILN